MDGSQHHTIGYQSSDDSQKQVYEGWSPRYELRDPRFWELTISMAECEGLALVIIVKIEQMT